MYVIALWYILLSSVGKLKERGIVHKSPVSRFPDSDSAVNWSCKHARFAWVIWHTCYLPQKFNHHHNQRKNIKLYLLYFPQRTWIEQVWGLSLIFGKLLLCQMIVVHIKLASCFLKSAKISERTPTLIINTGAPKGIWPALPLRDGLWRRQLWSHPPDPKK